MRKKIIIISSIVLICLTSVSIYLIFTHSLEKNNDETIKVADKKDSEKEKLENSVDNSEKNVEEKFEESIIDDKEKMQDLRKILNIQYKEKYHVGA